VVLGGAVFKYDVFLNSHLFGVLCVAAVVVWPGY
jgi:hypothetical protein